jgi:hypothetical protein
LREGLSGWGACTRAAAASASKRQTKEFAPITVRYFAKTFSRDLARVNLKRGKGEENMATENKSMPLRHYTSIDSLFNILDTSCLLLSNPEKWEDKNDYAAVQAFCRRKGKGTKARVLCFLDGEESIHHWKGFAKYGCSISFDRQEILDQTKKGNNFLCYPVDYRKTITAEELRKMDVKKIPFLKRNQYKCEEEYRIIWFGTGEAPKIHFKRETAIKHITLSPIIPNKSRENIKEHLETKYGIEVEFSRVLEFKPWIDRFKNLD